MLFLPLDIPPIPNKDIIIKNFYGKTQAVGYDKDKELVFRDVSDDTLSQASDVFYQWKAQQLSDKGTWNSFARKTYPDLIKWIDDYYPFETILDARLERAKGPVLPHTDGASVGYVGRMMDSSGAYIDVPSYVDNPQAVLDHQLENEPIGYRFIVHGSRDTLYMCKDEQGKNKVYCDIPKNTDAYVINHCTQLHGMDPKPDIDDERIVGFIIGTVNTEKHNILLKKSANKYKEYIITANELRV